MKLSTKRTFQLAIAASLAVLVAVLVVVMTWPAPSAVVEVPGFFRSALVNPLYAKYEDRRPPDNVAPYWLQWVIYRKDHSVGFSTSPQQFLFLNCETGESKGIWNAIPSSPRYRFGNERFDHRGRVLLHEGTVDRFSKIETKFIHRVDPATLKHEVFPAPSDTDLIGYRICEDGSRLIRFHGGKDKPLRIDLVDMEDMSVVNSVSFPQRIGHIETWQAQVAMTKYALSPDGRYIVMTESWNQNSRKTPAGVEVWDLRSGELAYRFSLVDEVAESKLGKEPWQPQDFPITSVQNGHHWPRWKRVGGETYVLAVVSHRKRYGPENGWQMNGFKHKAYNLRTGKVAPWSEVGFPEMPKGLVEYEVPYLDGKSIDGSRELWLPDSSRWKQKSAMLTDQNLKPISGMADFSFVRSTGFDGLGGYPLPDSNLIYLACYLADEPRPGFQEQWWQRLPPEAFELVRPPAPPTPYRISEGRAVIFDFEAERFQVFRRRIDKRLRIGSHVCQKNRVVLLLNKKVRVEDGDEEARPRIEIWDVPIKQPRLGWAAVAGLAMFGCALTSFIAAAWSKR